MMKIIWKKKKGEERLGKKRCQTALLLNPDLPFTTTVENEASEPEDVNQNQVKHRRLEDSGSKSDAEELANSFQSQGNRLAEEGKYREALGKWEAALMLSPEKAVLHEQKAQVLLEVGDAWAALKAATRATELKPSWAEAWITLARAQLNFGEPGASIESFDRAFAIKPDSEDGKADRETAIQLVKRREELNSSDMCATEGRFLVRDNQKFMVLTGAGISTESGIPDYRRNSFAQAVLGRDIGQGVMLDGEGSLLRSLVLLIEHWLLLKKLAGLISSLLKMLIGSYPLELHGTVYSVVCLQCGASVDRSLFQDEVKVLNPKWAAAIESIEHGSAGSEKSFGMKPRPDADVEIDEKFWEDDFEIPNCRKCNGLLKPDAGL